MHNGLKLLFFKRRGINLVINVIPSRNTIDIIILNRIRLLGIGIHSNKANQSIKS